MNMEHPSKQLFSHWCFIASKRCIIPKSFMKEEEVGVKSLIVIWGMLK